MPKYFKIITSVLIVLMSSVAAASSGVTYHGRILRNDTSAVQGQFVGFRIRVMDGNTGACQMYEEIHTKDMRNSGGVFSLVVGDGSVVGTMGVSGLGHFDQLFENNKTFNFNVSHVCEFTPYLAAARDGRKLNVSFREDTMSPWEDLPVMTLAYVPFAYSSLVAQKVGNHGDGSLLRVENAGTPSAVTALTPTQYANLMTLANGASTQYVQSVLGTASQITVNTAAGVATVGLADVGTAGTYGSATQVPVFTVDAKGRVTSVTNTTITGAAPTGAAGGDLTGNFPSPDIAALAVGTAEIAALAVTDAKLAANAVTTAKILDANVTLDKLATDSVNSAKIVDGSITGTDISSTAALSVASVTATGAVTSDSVSTRSIGLFELPVNGTNYIAHKAPDLLAGNTTYIWPAAAPGSNMVLQSDNTGVLSWVADAVGSAPGDASYAAKGVVQFDTNAATSGITIASGIAKLATSGVVANTYGAAATVPVITVDAFGRVTSVTDTPISVNASAIAAGVLPIARGGTNSGTALNNNRMMISSGGAIVEAAAMTNGQIMIGSTGAAPVAAALTAGTGVTINNTAGGIEISAAGSGGTITALTGDVTASGTGSVAATIANDAVTFAKFQNITDNRILGRSAGSNGDMQEITVGTGLSLSAGTLTATATAPSDASYAAKGIVQFDTDAATSGIAIASGIAKLATSGVVAATYGTTAAKKVSINVDAFGRITAASEADIAIAASQVTSGVLDVARGGTGTSALTANRMFIANGTGTALVADACTIGQVLEFDGTNWICKASSTFGAANAYVQSGNAFGAKAVLGTTDNNDLEIITNNTAKMTVKADGNVGIGTTSPSMGGTSANAGKTYLTIQGNSNSGVLQLASRSADADGAQLGNIEWVDANSSDANKRAAYISVLLQGATANNRGSYIAFATRADNASSALERFKITNAGDGIIGVAGGNPQARFDIVGSTNDNTASALNVRNPGGTTILRARNDGNVGIGTNAPDATLDVKGTLAVSGATSGAVKFAVPAAAGSATYTWPAAAPGSNRILQSDSSGNLSWVADATGSAPADASYAAKGIVQFDTDAATSGITVASGIAKLANSGVVAATYGAADKVPVFAVDAFGRMTTVTDTNIAIAASAVTSGILDVARGGTGSATLTANRMFMANGLGTALIADTCTVGQVLRYDGTNWLCVASNTLGAANAYVQSGNAFGAKAVLGTTDNNALEFITNNTAKMTVLANGNVGIGTTTPSEKLDIQGTFAMSGSTSGAVKFAVPAAAGSATYTWPAAAPASNMVLQSDSSGVLSWVAAGGSVADDSLDFTKFSDTMTLDASTSITAPSGQAYALTITNEGTGNSFVVNDQATDTTPFVINASGNVGIRNPTPLFPLDVSHGAMGMVVGGDVGTSTRTDLTAKAGALGAAHYENAQPPVVMIKADSTATESIVSVGGNSSSGNAATNIRFFTATQIDAGVGTERMRIDNTKTDIKGNLSLSGSTSGAVTFAVPAAAGSATYTWPAAAPASNMVLQSTSAGVLSWVSAAGGSGDFKADGTVNMTGAFRAATGTAALPGISFAGDPNTGIYSTSDDYMHFIGNGVTIASLSHNGLDMNTVVKGTGASAAGTPSFSFTGAANANTGIFNPANDVFAISTDGTERVRVTATGDVGIGRTPSGAKLDVLGVFAMSGSTSGAVKFAVPAAAGSATYTWPAAAPASNMVLQSSNSGALSWVAGGGSGDFLAAGTVPMTGNIRLNGNYLSNDGGNEGIRVTNSGDVNVGTTTNPALMTVVGTSGTGGIQLTASDGTDRLLMTTSGSYSTNFKKSHASGALKFESSTGVEEMRIDSNGRVGIGTDAPGATLHIVNEGATAGDLWMTAYGDNVGIHGRRARGTNASPTAVQSNDLLTSFGSYSYYASAWTTGTVGSVNIKASENHTSTAQGSYVTFETTANGTNASTAAERMRIDNAGNVGIGTSTPATKLDIAGSATLRQAYYESVGALGSMSCGATNITGFTTNIYELTACSSGTTTMNIPTVTGWPSGNMSWNVTFFVTGQTASKFNVTYNGSTAAVFWDKNSTGGAGGAGYTGFDVTSGTTAIISCAVINTSSVRLFCGVGAQY